MKDSMCGCMQLGRARKMWLPMRPQVASLNTNQMSSVNSCLSNKYKIWPRLRVISVLRIFQKCSQRLNVNHSINSALLVTSAIGNSTLANHKALHKVSKRLLTLIKAILPLSVPWKALFTTQLCQSTTLKLEIQSLCVPATKSVTLRLLSNPSTPMTPQRHFPLF